MSVSAVVPFYPLPDVPMTCPDEVCGQQLAAGFAEHTKEYGDVLLLFEQLFYFSYVHVM